MALIQFPVAADFPLPSISSHATLFSSYSVRYLLQTWEIQFNHMVQVQSFIEHLYLAYNIHNYVILHQVEFVVKYMY